jgi:RNA polymerase sigma-70 factor, ECF subfamily
MEDSVRELADFDAVVRLYWPRVFRFALASLRDRDAAQTVAQDCFLRAYRARDRFRGEARVLTWLLQIAVNLVRDHTRQCFRTFPVQPDVALDWVADGEIDPEQRVLIKEQIETLWRATASLPERQRTVFLLRYVEELELLEIAAVTGLKEGAVKVHLYRALRRVRAQLSGRSGRLR